MNNLIKEIKIAQTRAIIDSLEKQCQFKLGQSVIVKKRIGESKKSYDQPNRYRFVPAIVVDIIEIYGQGDKVELRVAPKLKNERVGNPLIRWWSSDENENQVFTI